MKTAINSALAVFGLSVLTACSAADTFEDRTETSRVESTMLRAKSQSTMPKALQQTEPARAEPMQAHLGLDKREGLWLGPRPEVNGVPTFYVGEAIDMVGNCKGFPSPAKPSIDVARADTVRVAILRSDIETIGLSTEMNFSWSSLLPGNYLVTLTCAADSADIPPVATQLAIKLLGRGAATVGHSGQLLLRAQIKMEVVGDNYRRRFLGDCSDGSGEPDDLFQSEWLIVHQTAKGGMSVTGAGPHDIEFPVPGEYEVRLTCRQETRQGETRARFVIPRRVTEI